MDRLWKITGTGEYFDHFYVKADNLPMALAKALDIMQSGQRAQDYDNLMALLRSVKVSNG